MNEQLRQAIKAAQQMSDEAQHAIAARILEEIKSQEWNTIMTHPEARDKLLQEKREDILRIAKENGAFNVRVLGPEAAASDIDFLVDLEPGRNLLDLGGLMADLQDLFGHEVGVVTERGLRSSFQDEAKGEYALKEAIPL
jgi:predicted nucleotidyltransferase